MAQTIRSPFGTVIIDPDDTGPIQHVFGSKEGEKTHRHRSIDMTPTADIYEDESQLTVWIDLPGVDKETINLSIVGQVLNLSAQTKKLNMEGGYWVRHERPVGSYARRLQLSHAVEADGIAANYADGTLRLTIPKPKAEESTAINITMD